ncbi:MAG: hypothetical protein AAGK32_02805 [Actinomycetota bacterium]
MIGWIALLCLLALFSVLAYGAGRAWARHRDAEEQEAWRAVAQAIDHAYSTADVPHELDQLPLPLLQRLDEETVAPELTGPSEGGIQRLFIASVDGDRLTIGVADLARPVPDVSLRPTATDAPPVGHAWAELDPGHAHIRSRFEVRGADADAVEALLGTELGGWLAGEGMDWSIELAGSHVLMARPELEVERFTELATALDEFRARLPWVVAAEAARAQRAEKAALADNGGGGQRRKRKKRKRRGRGGGSSGSGGGGAGQSDEAGSGRGGDGDRSD